MRGSRFSIMARRLLKRASFTSLEDGRVDVLAKPFRHRPTREGRFEHERIEISAEYI